MADIIAFLEKLGQDAQLRHASSAEMEEALRSAGFEPAVRSAILGMDDGLLESIVGVRRNACCLINPAQPAEEEDETEEQDEEQEDEDGDEQELH